MSLQGAGTVESLLLQVLAKQDEILATQEQQGKTILALEQHYQALNDSDAVQSVATAFITSVLADSREMTGTMFEAIMEQPDAAGRVNSEL